MNRQGTTAFLSSCTHVTGHDGGLVLSGNSSVEALV